MDANEAYALGVEFGKKVGASMDVGQRHGDTVEKFVKAGQALCGTEIFSAHHPLAHTAHNDETKAAFARGERDGLRQVFVKKS